MISRLKVIDASTVLAGPSVGMFFAELGAEVIKVENPILPDVTRSWKTALEDKDSTVSAYFSSINFRKTYLKIDLKEEAGRNQFIELIREADVLITNFKKGDATKFNITDELLFAVNPSLIHGKISGFGPDSDRVAYDLILQAETGLMSMNGTPESGPVKMPVAFIDVLAAHQLKEGLLLALLERTQTGKGKSVEVSLYETAVCSLVNQASAYLMTHSVPQRIGSLHPSIAPYGEIFRTKDESQITFAIGSDSHFSRLCTFLDMNHLPEDSRFSDNQNRVINRSILFDILQEKIATHSAAPILTWMEEHSVPCGKIKTLKDVFDAPGAEAFIREEEIEGVKTRRVTSIAFK